MMQSPFEIPASWKIWDSKYRYREGSQVFDDTIEDTWSRVARVLARVEGGQQEFWTRAFQDILQDFRFLPAGRIMAGAGTGRRVTLFNCFVMGTLEDSLDGIFDALKEGALTMQHGGGVGYDFSTLRPAGTLAKSVGGIASGPVSFMRIWDSMCATLLSTGARRGAMMATLRCDHPDIEDFVTVKQDSRELRHFNLSVLVSDAFMEAVTTDAEWPLVFPARQLAPPAAGTHSVERDWPGADGPVPCRILRVVHARELWDRIMRASYDTAEPGVLFIDRINRQNNLAYREHITATNPCGEIPLPPYGACNLGSLNLTRFVQRPFTGEASLDLAGVREAVRTAVRMLDNVIDVSHFAMEQQAEQARGSRRIGLGFTGLGDALIMLGIRYGDETSYRVAAQLMQNIRDTAYRTSTDLARAKGAFPFFEKDAYLRAPFVQRLPEDIRSAIAEHGIRNSHLTALAPAGTISLLANNVSSGIEPVYEFEYRRRIMQADGNYTESELSDYAWRLWLSSRGECALGPAFIRARDLAPSAHLQMQAALQPFIDNAISKTVNVAENLPYADFREIYDEAWHLGLKGCTTFRPNPVTGAVLSDPTHGIGAHCCDIDREND
jgi:ribonucleoside-diphosphate reductase alpha chain